MGFDEVKFVRVAQRSSSTPKNETVRVPQTPTRSVGLKQPETDETNNSQGHRDSHIKNHRKCHRPQVRGPVGMSFKHTE